MIPFQKVFTLIIRTFSRPMLNWLQQSQKENKMVTFRWIFIGVGHFSHRFEHWLNHTILKTTHRKQLTQLRQEILLAKGIQTFYQLIFYSIVVGLPLYQLYQGAVSAHKKEQKLQQNIAKMELQLTTLNQHLGRALSMAKERNQQRKQLKEERQKQLQTTQKRREAIRNQVYKQYCQRKEEQEKQIVKEAMGPPTDQPISTNLTFNNSEEVETDRDKGFKNGKGSQASI